MASWLSRLTPTERGEDPLKKPGEISPEKLGEVSQGKPQVEQDLLSDKLKLAQKQAQITTANDNEQNSEKETQHEYPARRINQLTKSGSPEPHAKEDGKGNGKAAACGWKGDPAEPHYDDLASQHNIPDHAEFSGQSQKSEGHTTTQERTGGNPKDSTQHQSGEHQPILPINTKDTTLKPAQGPVKGPAGVSAPRPTPTSDMGSTKKSSKESTKGASKTQPNPRKSQDGRIRSQPPSQKSDSKRSGHSKQVRAKGANSDEFIQGKESKHEPDDIKQHHVCKPFHEHNSPQSPSSDSQDHLGNLDPESMSAESEHAHGQGKTDHEHAGKNKVVAEVHPAGCGMHPDVKEEHLVTDNPRLGKMMAVYQKIEDKIKSKEDKEERAKRKQEEKAKKALEKKERREKRAREKQERRARRAKRREEAQATQTDTELKTDDELANSSVSAATAAAAAAANLPTN